MNIHTKNLFWFSTLGSFSIYFINTGTQYSIYFSYLFSFFLFVVSMSTLIVAFSQSVKNKKELFNIGEIQDIITNIYISIIFATLAYFSYKASLVSCLALISYIISYWVSISSLLKSGKLSIK